MRGIEALDFFLENWHSKIKQSGDLCEFDAVVEYRFGSGSKVYSTAVVVEKYYDRKITFEGIDEINEFLPEDVEFDSFSGNLYIKKNLFEVKIAPRIC